MTTHIPQRFLITGATGYIGSQLAIKLAQRGDHVHILCRAGSSLEQLISVKEKITIHIIDSTFDSIDTAVNRAKPEIVIHLASLFISEHQASQVRDLIHSNIEFPALLLESMHKNGVKHFINTGTSWQHFITDSENYHPTNLYSATKQAFEDVLNYYVEATRISALTLTIFDTFGANDPRKKLFYLFKLAQQQTEAIQMSSGEQSIDLVYISDVMDAYIEAIKQVQKNEGHVSYVIKTGKPYQLKEIAHLYEQISQKPLAINWGAKPYREREVFIPWQQGVTLPNWSAKILLEEGIAFITSQQESSNI